MKTPLAPCKVKVNNVMQDILKKTCEVSSKIHVKYIGFLLEVNISTKLTTYATIHVLYMVMDHKNHSFLVQ